MAYYYGEHGKKERNRLIYEEYEKFGKMKGGISFATLGKKYGIRDVTCRRIYEREKWREKAKKETK